MNYTMTNPCNECPFLKKNKRGYTMSRLMEFAAGPFACHKTADEVENEEDDITEYVGGENSQHCAGALIFNEKRNTPNQMMRIAERIGFYDRRKLNMAAEVR